MVGFLLVFFVGAIALVFLKVITKTIVSISGVFVSLWTITLSFSFLGLYEMNPPNFYVVGLGIISIIVFAFFGCFYGRKTATKPKSDLLNDNFVDKPPLSKKPIIFILTAIAYAYAYPFLIKSITLIGTYGWSYLRVASGLESYGTTAQRMVLQYFVQSLFIVTILVTCIDLINKKVYAPSLIVSILDTIIYAVLFGGRYIFLYWLVFIVFLLLCRKKGRTLSFLRRYKMIGLLLLLVVVAMAWLTIQRSSSSFVKSTYVYFCGSYSYLSYLIDNSVITDMHLLGLNQIGFVYNFVYSAITALFGVSYQGTNYLISSQTSQMVNIGGTIAYNALGTCLESFICDFGLYFAPIGLIVFSWCLNFFEYQYRIKKTPTWLGYYLIMVYVTVNTVFAYSFGSPGFLIVLILIPIFTWQNPFLKTRMSSKGLFLRKRA